MTVRVSDQQAAEFRSQVLPLQGTILVSGEGEEEDYKCWPLGLRIVPSGTLSQTCFGPQPLTLSSLFTVHDPKVIARVLRECFEQRNTLLALCAGSTIWTHPLVGLTEHQL